MFQHRYFAFLSYSHKDQALADWLHRRLETFRIPRALAGPPAARQIVPGTLRPIFRDRQELAAADDLGGKIRAAIAHSQFLLVLCSPAAAQSKWTNAEVDAFKRAHPNGCVLAAIAAGEPFASETPGNEGEECFPLALRRKYDRRGRPTSKRAEPIAADLRQSGDGKRIGLLKLVAGMLGVGLDELVRRDAHRRQRRLVWLGIAIVAFIIITGALATATIYSGKAAAGAREEAGDRRTQELELQANDAIQSGDAQGAERLYEQALTGTAEAMRRNPNDPARVFAHAQNVFYVGELALGRGDKRKGQDYMVEYRRLAGRLVQLQPRNLKWRTEILYADTNLGVMLFQDRHFDRAAARFGKAVNEAEVLVNAAPGDSARRQGVAMTIAWLADTRASEGRVNEAVALRERQFAILKSLSSSDNDDPHMEIELTNAHTGLASAYAAAGKRTLALEHFRAAVANSNGLIPFDNALEWYRTAIRARLAFAAFTLRAGNAAEGGAQTRSACDLAYKFRDRAGDSGSWVTERRDCWLMQTRLALAGGQNSEALAAAQRAVGISKAVVSGDLAADRFGRARALRLLGDAQNRSGNTAAAHDAWSRALAEIVPETRETPREMDEHARVLESMGRAVEAAQIKSRLDAIGYHSVE